MSLQSNDVSTKHFLNKVRQKCWNKEAFPDKAVDLVTVDLEDAHSSSHLIDSDGLSGGRLPAVLPTLTNISRPVYTAMKKVKLRQNTAYVSKQATHATEDR
jgi:hypothetical protein